MSEPINLETLASEIAALADKVMTLKTEGSDADAIKACVDALLASKQTSAQMLQFVRDIPDAVSLDMTMINQRGCLVADSKPNDDERATARLSIDYGEIAQLTELLNVQVTQFVELVNGMVESIPCQDALAEIFRERSIKNSADESMEGTQGSATELRVLYLQTNTTTSPTP